MTDMSEDYSQLTELEAIAGCLAYVVVAVWGIAAVLGAIYLVWRWMG